MVVKTVTLNPADSGAGFVLSNGNLTATIASNSNIRATEGKLNGKWYWEVLYENRVGIAVGVSTLNHVITNNTVTGTAGENLRLTTGAILNPENIVFSTLTFGAGDLIGINLDLDNGTLGFSCNGVYLGFSHTNLKLLGNVEWYPFFRSTGTSSKIFTVNFGATPFAYSPPEGFLPFNEFPNKKILFSNSEIFSLSGVPLVENNLVPTMTSNTAPSGEVSGSSVYTNSFIYYPWRAFDNIATTGWRSEGKENEWLQYKFPSKTVCNGISINSDTTSLTNMPTALDVLGSNDGINFEKLASLEIKSEWDFSQEKKLQFTNRAEFMYYRFSIKTVNGGEYVRIPQLSLYFTERDITVVESSSVDNFITFGSENPLNLLDFYDNKIYVSNASNKNQDDILTINTNSKPLNITLL